MYSIGICVFPPLKVEAALTTVWQRRNSFILHVLNTAFPNRRINSKFDFLRRYRPLSRKREERNNPRKTFSASRKMGAIDPLRLSPLLAPSLQGGKSTDRSIAKSSFFQGRADGALSKINLSMLPAGIDVRGEVTWLR